ncbi:hypothetical protein vseg_018222 [Gypsophila vaccaria]
MLSKAAKTALKSGCREQAVEQPPTIRNHHTHGHGTIASEIMLQLGNVVHDKSLVKDENSGTSSDSPSDEEGSSGLEDENTSTNDLNTKGSTAVANKCLQKSATFPIPAGTEGNEPESKLEDSKGYSRSLSMPVVQKLVSAMKGTREKEGIPSQKLSVKWASDVYDPLPTSVSHFPKKRNHQQQYSKNHKKHGKGKHKGKNTRGGGSGSKEKKHSHKTSGKSDRCLDSYADTDRVQNYKPSLEMLDFTEPGIGGPAPDPSCGSKFLGQASSTMHCVY